MFGVYVYDDELCLNNREMRLAKRSLAYLNPNIDINSKEFKNLTSRFKREFANTVENKESRYQAFKTALLVMSCGDGCKMLSALEYGSNGSITDRFIMAVNNSELLKWLHITPS